MYGRFPLLDHSLLLKHITIAAFDTDFGRNLVHA